MLQLKFIIRRLLFCREICIVLCLLYMIGNDTEGILLWNEIARSKESKCLRNGVNNALDNVKMCEER